MSTPFIRVGKVKDAHGIKGELFIVLFSGEAAWLDKLKTLRLVDESSQQSPKEFALKSARLHKNGMIIKTEELHDRTTAESLRGWLLEIPEDFLVSKPGESIYLREIHGFRVIVNGMGEVGVISGFGTNGAQDLLIIEHGSSEVEVPFVEAFVEGIDYKAREIRMNLPKGLIELSKEIAGDEA